MWTLDERCHSAAAIICCNASIEELLAHMIQRQDVPDGGSSSATRRPATKHTGDIICIKSSVFFLLEEQKISIVTNECNKLNEK